MEKSNDKSDNINEISYEEEQIQKILIEESEKQKLKMERELKISQDEEYQKCLDQDLNIDNLSISPSFEEPSVEEMRRVRLLRFNGWQLIKD
jgi:hypothetical protein